jgi:hypothetical protein
LWHVKTSLVRASETTGVHSCGTLKKFFQQGAASERLRRTLWGTLRA